MTPQQLKASILQYAIQGKLVEQRAEEGTGEELYQQIQAEKQRLIAEKKIKKEKPLPEITEDEVPFDIPESWKWVRIGAIFSLQAGKNITSSDIFAEQSEAHPYLCYGGNGIRGYVEKKNREGYYAIIGRQGALCGNINVAKGVFYATEHAVVVDHFGKTDVMWSAWFLMALNLNQYATATAQPGLSVANIVQVPIPLPPFAEQKRIVAKIEELLPLVDRYAAAYEKLEKFNAKFPEDMKKSILQYAIQGKLVEQRAEEGTGEELFQQIQAEKQRLIAEKKIKKEKALAEIADDEIPFDIPESWKWVRLGSITNKLTDGSHNPPPNTGAGYPVISAKNVKNGLITFENVDRFTDEVGFAKENPRTDISCGDIIMGIIGGSIGNIAVYTHEEKVIAQRSIAIIKTLAFTDYIVILLKSPLVQNMLKASAAGSAQGGVYLGTLGNLLIPLPPLAEQKRIVAKLDELLPLCERLK